jgi:hypothetical protein
MHTLLAHKFEFLENRTEDFLNDLSPYDLQILQKQPTGNTWSAIQIVNHLILSETGTVNYLNKKILGIDSVREANLLDKGKMILFRIYMLGWIKFKAPRGVNKPANDSTLEEVINKWKDLRHKLAEFLNDYDSNNLNKVIFKHPFFGRLTISQTLDFLALHIRHHHKQLKNRVNQR